MPHAFSVRDLQANDTDAALTLNEHEVPRVSPVTAAELEQLVRWSEAAIAATAGDSLVGFAIVLGPGTAYGSANYRWFAARYADFAYLDRIVVASGQRRSGVGTELWSRVEATFPERMLCCEVNVDPPNPASLAFHEALGFESVGTRGGGASPRVSLLVKRAREDTANR